MVAIKEECELVYSRRGNQECEKFENIAQKSRDKNLLNYSYV